MSTKRTEPGDDKFRAAIKAEMDEAVGLSGSVLSTARAALKDAYLGNPLSIDEERRVAGWSTYQDRTVLETVEWAKPGLMRVFASSDEIVRFEPNRPEQEQSAADATDYINHVVFGGNAFSLIYDILTDSLMQRIAWGKVYYDTEAKKDTREYTGLSEEEAVALLTQHDDADVSQGKDGTYNLTVTVDLPSQPVRIDSLPSEQVIWNKDARNMESCRFVAHWENRTIAELEAEGYDSSVILDELKGESGSYPEADIQARVNSDSGADDVAERDGKMRIVRVFEAYMLMPDAGKGECRYRIVYAGEDAQVILKSEKWTMPRPPLFPVSSVPLPHQIGGLCLADLVLDIQMLRTELSRQLLDSLALSNQGEFVVKQRSMNDQVDMDQFLARRIGGVYRTLGDVDIVPMPSDSRAAQEAAGALRLTDALKGSRTGVGQQTQGMQADALQNTATGALVAEDASNQRIELIARILAESFFKPIAQYTLLLVSRHQNKPIQARMRGKFFNWDPMQWDPYMDVSVSVGLGTGNRSRQTQALQLLLGYQEKFIEALGKNSPIRLSHIMHALHAMARGMGFTSPEQFFGTVEDAQAAEQKIMQEKPQPSPEEQKIQLEQQKAQAQLQLQQQKDQADTAQQNARAQADMQLQQAEAQAKMQLERAEAEARASLEREKAAANMQLQQERLRSEMEMDSLRMAIQGASAPGTQQLRSVQV